MPAGTKLHELTESFLKAVETTGYQAGLVEGASRLETLAAIIPSSTTKTQLLELAAGEAAVLRARAAKCEASMATVKALIAAYE